MKNQQIIKNNSTLQIKKSEKINMSSPLNNRNINKKEIT